MADVSELHFGADVAAYGERCTAVFSRWEEEGGAPTLTAMIARYEREYRSALAPNG